MAKVKVPVTLNPHEWMSLAGGILVAGACYALLIHPSLQSLADLPRCREDKQAAQHELDQARATLQRTHEQIAEGKTLLSKLGGGPPPASQKDRQIARLTALADRCHVKIMQYVPIDTVEHVDHRAFMVEFVGQGNFVDIQRLFGLVESTVAFVDVTNFAISKVQGDESSQCLVTWACRINGVRPGLKAPALAAGGTGPRDTPMEVARYEP